MKASKAQNQSKPSNLVKTIERASLILDILGKSPQGISIKKLSAKTGLPKGTAHRFLSSLAYFDYVRQNSMTKNYHLGFKLVELGNRLLDQIDLRTEAHPFLVELAERTKETVHMVILDHHEALYVDKVESSEPAGGLRMASVIGARIPTHCSAVGKVMLAFLPEERLVAIVKDKGLPRRTENTITDIEELKQHLQLVRKQGYALDDEENEKGVKCLGAPIRDQNGKVETAISISVPGTRVRTDTLLTTLKDQVTETAMKISQKLGYY
ncbi:Transcriptional regulator, IclR family [Olavius sp. associated proteobacterium Delta 1]|nr:Transcriptional regulator, IclR family [Olavius sp. associated proteobacterium Delta 1]